jgi:hypothetical protein
MSRHDPLPPPTGGVLKPRAGAVLNRWLLGSGAVALVVVLLLQALLVAFPLEHSLLGLWWVQAAIVTGGVSLYFFVQWLFRVGGAPQR